MKQPKKILAILAVLLMTLITPNSLSTFAALAAAPDNLIANPSLENGDENGPTSWLKGNWGLNNCAFSYPVSGVNDGVAAKIDVSSYTDGDCKWYFAPVAVVPGRTYEFTDKYISNSNSLLVAQYLDVNHNPLSYSENTLLPTVDNNWQSGTAIFNPPVGTAYMTVFHLLNLAGSLTIDEASLKEVLFSNSFDEGFVSLTFDDGFENQYLNAFPKLEAADIKGTFYLITHATPGVSIINLSLNVADGDQPASWLHTNTDQATFSYPVAGYTDNAAMVSSTNENSNAGWRFKPISVLAGPVYEFSEWYQSTADSKLVARIKLNDGSHIRADVTDINGNTLDNAVYLPASAVWKQIKTYFYVPDNAKTITVINRLQGIGDLSIDDVTLGVANRLNKDKIQEMQAAGEEIGGHSQTHPNLTTLNSTQQTAEITGSRSDLLDNGISPILSFSYPYGAYNDSIKEIAKNAGYNSGRTVIPGFNSKTTDKFALYTQSVNADTDVATVKQWIDQAQHDKSWLILTFHQITNDNSAYSTTPENFQEIIDYIKSVGIKTHTVSEGVALMDEVAEPTLDGLSITSAATKLDYTIGDTLDISGLVVTGLYSDNSSKIETVTLSDISGFDSSATSSNQVLTITIKGKTTSYSVNINAQSNNGGGDNGSSGGNNGSGDNSGDNNKTFASGGGAIVYCQSAQYVCINKVKNIVSQTPATCSFTAAQLSRIDEPCEDNNNGQEPAQQVLGVQKYAIGTLLRSKSNHRVYVVISDTAIQHVLNLKELAQYKDRVRLDVDESVIAAYSQVLGIRQYADGTLVRTRGNHKIYVIINGERVYIKTIKELLKYLGQPILDIE